MFFELPHIHDEVEITAARLNSLIEGVFNEWGSSAGEVGFSERMIETHGKIHFGETVFSSMPKRSVAGALREGIRKRELVIAVIRSSTAPVFTAGSFRPANVAEDDPAKLISAFFPSNFFERCGEERLDPRKVAEDCLGQLFYWDVKTKAEKTPRVKLNLPDNPALVLVQREREENATN